jgi:putative ABC transport system permease protein
VAAERIEEIGIRKVLGASNFRIISILISSIARIVMIASLTASVIAYLIMSEWLEDFYYHDEINFWAFISAAILAAGIASVTKAVQSYNATTANPISALRYE